MIRLALALCLLPGLAFAEQGDGQKGGRKRKPRRESPAAEQPAPTTPTTPQMVMPDFRYTQTRGNKKVFSIFAKRAETYPNKDVLLFDVEELLLYSEDGRVSKLTSEFGRWNGSAGDFEVWGNVKGVVQTGEKEIGDTLRFETDKLVYKDAWKAVVTMKPVRLETANAVTTGVGLNYNLVSQDLVISNSVVTTLKLAASVAAGIKLGDPTAGSRLVITAGQLLLQPEKKRAVYSTEPVLKMDENHLSGKEMEFFLARARKGWRSREESRESSMPRPMRTDRSRRRAARPSRSLPLERCSTSLPRRQPSWDP
jgi:LPS export ABC transporter protein LptC